MHAEPEAGSGPGTVIAGHRLLRLLGSGVQSQVFLAQRLDNGDTVALKLAALASGGSGADAAAQDFLRAAQVARQLRHPHIVAVHAVGVEAGLGWLSMEAVAGGDLHALTQAAPLLTLARATRIGHGLALALAYAHRQGVVHRDLKPGNVLIANDSGDVKLADFGLARTMGGSGHTGTGIVPGTPAYMAPELLAGATPDAATDLYALGVLLFELLAGRHPHPATRMGELLQRVAQEPAPDLLTLRPALPPALAALVARLLAKAARQRPADAEAVAVELHALHTQLAAR